VIAGLGAQGSTNLAGDVAGARTLLNEELARIGIHPASPLVDDAQNLIRSTLAGMEDEAQYFRCSRKVALSSKMSFSRGSSFNRRAAGSAIWSCGLNPGSIEQLRLMRSWEAKAKICGA